MSLAKSFLLTSAHTSIIIIAIINIVNPYILLCGKHDSTLSIFITSFHSQMTV